MRSSLVLALLLAACHTQEPSHQAEPPMSASSHSQASTSASANPSESASAPPSASAKPSMLTNPSSQPTPPPSAQDARITIKCDSAQMWAWIARPGDNQPLLTRRVDFGPLEAISQPGGANYEARPCAGGVTFTRPAGKWVVGVHYDGGWAEIYSMPTKELTLQPRMSLELEFHKADFQHTGSCCHCPFVSVVDPASNNEQPAFEVLGGRSQSGKRGSDRYPLRVPVHHHAIVLRLREIEQEISHIDSVRLESADGTSLPLAPSGADPDNHAPAPLILGNGDQVTMQFVDPRVDDGEDNVVLIVTGYYEPLAGK